MGRTILAAAVLAAVLATAAHPTTTTTNPMAPTNAAKEQPATAKQVVTKTPTPTPKPSAKPSAPPVTTKPAPPTTSSRQLRYTARRDIEVQTMCDDNGNAYDIQPNTAPARERAAEMCNNLQVGLDRAGFSH